MTTPAQHDMAEKQISQIVGDEVYGSTKSDAEIGQSVAISTSVKSYGTGLVCRFLRKLEIEPQPGSFAPGHLSNKDLDPIQEKDRTWRSYNYVMYWISDAFGPGNWRLGSSLISLGLSWKLTLGVIALGHFLISLVITVNGVIGARYHVAFTIQARSAFGYKFSFVMVVIRMIVAVFWYGINTYTGAECVRSMIFAMAPGFRDIPNHLPESANITTQMMICFFIYFCLVMPFHFISPQKMRWFFTFKSTFTPIAGFAIMGWILNATGGTNTPLFKGGNAVSGKKLTWAFISALNNMLANYATLAVNINDFTRYAKKSRMTYIQIFVIPACFLLMGFWGIVGASGSELLYGEILWDPLLLIDRWTSSGGRAAAFFCGLAFCIAQIGANLSANAITAANDMNAILPRYINIRRGQILTAVIGAWVLTPWNILTSAAGLLNFMSGYTIWLAPISGILLGDYFVVRKQTMYIKELYRPDGIYSYGNKYGTNWRAFIAFNIGWIPLLPGFIRSINSNIALSEGGLNLYNLGYIYGFSSSLAVYCLLSQIWEPTSTLHHEDSSSE